MSEEGQEENVVETDTGAEEAGKSFSQEEVNGIVKERLARERGRFSDYEDLKAFKTNAEKARLATLSEAEQAVEKAKIEARLEVQSEYATRLVAAEARAALAGVLDPTQIDDVLEDLNLSRYVTSDGEVDQEAIKKLRTKYEGLVGKKVQTGNLGHGRQNNPVNSSSPAEQFAQTIGELLS